MVNATRKRKKKKPTKRVTKLRPRSAVPAADCWDLKSLFSRDDAWEKAFVHWQKKIDGYEQFRGKLAHNVKTLVACLQFHSDLERAGERLAYYAHLKTAEDSSNDHYQRMMGRYRSVAREAEEAASFIRPELLAIPANQLKKYLKTKTMEPWRLVVERLVRYKPHTLSRREERLLAMQSEMASSSQQTFQQLHNSDIRFGTVCDENGEQIELAHGNLSRFMESPKRSVRRKAYQAYYSTFSQYQHTLATTLSGSIQKDVYYARARGHDSALSAALFPDRVPEAVYQNLTDTVSDHLPALHKYYALRARLLRLKTFHLYDQYVPLLSSARFHHTWQQAVDLILESLTPLGKSYCSTLARGLNGNWCDRYPNLGKTSGAFSAGSYDGNPYILMNFQPDVLNDVFTLTHEAGHSMHSYYSAKHQPFPYYDYTIFVAEVASTFNEQLLSKHLLATARNKNQRSMLLARELDNIRGTIYRQTMFAEFERSTHVMCEAGEPLTLDALQDIYRQLLKKYLGPQLEIDEWALLECLRIPHFYRAFYVYKYATGMSAAIALADQVTEGGRKELDTYLNFLKAGRSQYPLELLQNAGVDMTRCEPVAAALDRFEKLVEALDESL